MLNFMRSLMLPSLSVMKPLKPLITIVGATGTGKSKVSIVDPFDWFTLS